MFGNECSECAKTNKLMEEKEKKLSVYQNNLFELKSKMMETSNMINVYFNYKNENEYLRKENENLRKKCESGSVSNVSNSAKINYEFEILKNKYLKECERSKTLEMANTQLSALVDELKCNQEGSLRTEINKLKKEISDKERHINSQNSLIERMKSEMSENKGKTSPRIEERNYEDIFDVGNNGLNNINNSIILKNVQRENDFLKKKYQKYQMKYIKFKAKYKTLKSVTKYYNPANTLNPMNSMFLTNKTKRDSENIMEYAGVNYNTLPEFPSSLSVMKNDNTLVQKNIISRKESLSKSVDLFENQNDYMFEDNKDREIMIVEEDKGKVDENEEKSVKSKKASNKKGKRGRKKNKSKEEEVKEKKPKGKKGRKKQVSEEEVDDVDEVGKIGNEEEEELPPSKKRKNHINPLKKEKIDLESIRLKQKEEFIENFINHINLIDYKEESTLEYIKNFDPSSTIHDKINKIIEVILEISNQLELPKVLYFLQQFAIFYKDTKIILNVKEYILSHFDTFTAKSNQSFKCETDIEETAKMLKNIYNHHTDIDLALIYNIKENYLNIQYLISYLLGIFYSNMPIVKQFSQLIFELVEKYNVGTSRKILVLFRKLTLNSRAEINIDNDNSEEMTTYRNGINKIFILNSMKHILIDEAVFGLMLAIIDCWVKDGANVDEENELIKQTLNKKINEIENNIEIREINNDKINFAIDIKYLEVLQVIHLAFKIKDIDWIYNEIFVEILWNKFIESKQESMKRVGIVYYISFLFDLFLIKDPQYTNSNTQFLLNWVYSIAKNESSENQISVYDRIAALSGLIDTNLIKYDQAFYLMIKGVIDSLGKDTSNFPDDFIEKLKKLKLI